MAKQKLLIIRITEQQDSKLIELARNEGFRTKSEYVRSTLFRQKPLLEKIDAIYHKVCQSE